ncbi:MAG: C45 family peptidase [Planctomycetes bacterium]|nr:C45 family peptidase [Planctomycetota bacterium]
MIQKLVLPAALIFSFAVNAYADEIEVKTFGENTMVTQHGLSILHLKGSAYETSLAYANLIGEMMYEGYLPTAADKLDDAIRGVLPEGFLQNLGSPLADGLFFMQMELGGSDDASMVQAFNDVLDNSRVSPLKAYFSPDAQHVLVARAESLGIARAETGIIESFGCSSAIAFGEKTADGARIFGRNQDYFGIGSYDKYPCVSFVEPDVGYRFVCIAPVGLFTAGITAMNEKGLAIGLHSALTKNVNLGGVPILTAIHRVVQRCASIDEAAKMMEEIASTRGNVSGWLCHITDRVDGVAHAAVIEIDGAGVTVVRRDDGTSALTNNYTAKDRREDELHFSFTTAYQNRTRLDRLNARLGADEEIDLGDMLDIMRDRVDSTTSERISYSPYIVTAIDQVKSVIFLPDELAFYVGIDGAPVTHGRWLKLSLENGFADGYTSKNLDFESVGSGPERIADEFPGYPHFVDAYVKKHQEFDADGAIESLRLAVQVDDCPYYKLALGAMLLKRGDVSEGAEFVEAVKDDTRMHVHQRRLAKFLFAASGDVLGNSEAARVNFAEVAGDPETWETLKSAARSFADAEFPASKLADIDFNLKFMDGISYPTDKNELRRVEIRNTFRRVFRGSN